MGAWSQVAQYLYLKKKDPDSPKSFNVKAMHGINRISIFMFLFGIIILLFKLFRH